MKWQVLIGQPGEIVLIRSFALSVHVGCNLCSADFSHSDSSDGLPLGLQDTSVSTDYHCNNALSCMAGMIMLVVGVSHHCYA